MCLCTKLWGKNGIKMRHLVILIDRRSKIDLAGVPPVCVSSNHVETVSYFEVGTHSKGNEG